MKNLLGNKYGWMAIAAIVGAGLYFVSVDQPEASATTLHVESKQVSRGDIRRSIAATGRVRALVTVEVGSQLSGKVDELYADYNDTVSKGDIVAEIDPQTFQQRVLQNSADLETANANIKIQEATITRAVATLKQAELDFKRMEPLARDGAISGAALDNSRATRDAARASLDIAEAQLLSAKASVKQREAALASAQIDLERTKIRSPIDGVIIERNVDRGQTVAASLSAPTLFKIAQDLTEIQIEASVDESDIGRVRAGNSVSFTVDAHEDQSFTGTVDQVRLSPTELNNVVTYTVVVNASNRRLLLLPGMTANLEIQTGEREGVLRLPNQALRVRPTEDMKALADSAQETNGDAASNRRGQGGGQAMLRMLAELGVAPETQEKISASMRQAFEQMRNQMQNAPDRNQAREMMRARMDKILRTNLSKEQVEKLQSMRQARAEIRRAQVWVQEADGNLKPVNVRLGIADDEYSEIVGGDLTEGTSIVTRIRQVRQ